MGSPHHRPVRPLTAGYGTPLFLMLLVAARCVQAQSPPSDNNNPYFTNANFNPSMAIVIVVLISAFFFLGFFSIYIRQCTGAGSDRNSVRGLVAAGRSRRQRGLDQEVLSTFPTLVYSEVKEHKIGKGALECAVCLCEFEDDETLRLLPKCDHVFHPDCIDAWLAAHVTCPVCRTNLVPDPNDPDKENPNANDLSIPVVPAAVADADVPPVVEHVIAVDQAEHADDQRNQEQADLERIINIKRAKSTRARPVKFPRSHSTGHSVVQPGENLDRFTLRLPENMRKEIVAAGKANLQRTRSLLVPAGEGSSRRGFRRGGGDGSSGRFGRPIQLGRSDRWPSFLTRTLSMKMPAWGRRGDQDGSWKGSDGGSMKGGKMTAAVRSPLDCLGGGANGEKSESSTSALNRV